MNIETDGGFIRISGTEGRVAQLLGARQQVGIRKYGVTVEDNPLAQRQWLQHALEEACDLAVYLQRCIDNLDKVEHPYKPLMDPRVGTRIHGECWAAFDPKEDGK